MTRAISAVEKEIDARPGEVLLLGTLATNNPPARILRGRSLILWLMHPTPLSYAQPPGGSGPILRTIDSTSPGFAFAHRRECCRGALSSGMAAAEAVAHGAHGRSPRSMRATRLAETLASVRLIWPVARVLHRAGSIVSSDEPAAANGLLEQALTAAEPTLIIRCSTKRMYGDRTIRFGRADAATGAANGPAARRAIKPWQDTRGRQQRFSSRCRVDNVARMSMPGSRPCSIPSVTQGQGGNRHPHVRRAPRFRRRIAPGQWPSC